MYNCGCPDCNDAKLQLDKNTRKINEVIEQVNVLIQVNNETADFIEEKVNEVVGDVAEREVNEVIGDLIEGNGKNILVSPNGTKYKLVVSDDGTLTTIPYSSDYINGRLVIWQDDFEGYTLDLTKWRYEIGNVRDNELQYYSSDNVSIEDSCLVITAKKEKHSGVNNTREWTSGAIEGYNLNPFTYGRFEARMKLPNVVGSFPAFWMMGNNHSFTYFEDGTKAENLGVPWSQCGEIDIMEQMPGNGDVSCNVWKSTGVSAKSSSKTVANTSEWHIYSVEWTPSSFEFFIDDVSYMTFDITSSEYDMYRMPFYMILNLAVGKSGGTPSSDLTEMKMYVDWVRVYAPLEDENSITGLSIPTTATVNVGESIKLDVQLTPSNTSDTAISWTTSNNTIARVNYEGTVYGLSEGECNIIATSKVKPSIFDSCKVTVSKKIVDLSDKAFYIDGRDSISDNTVINRTKDSVYSFTYNGDVINGDNCYKINSTTNSTMGYIATGVLNKIKTLVINFKVYNVFPDTYSRRVLDFYNTDSPVNSHSCNKSRRVIIDSNGILQITNFSTGVAVNSNVYTNALEKNIYLCLVHQETNLKVYVNGELKQTITNFNNLSNYSSIIGITPDNGITGRPKNECTMDLYSFYGYENAITDEDVKELYDTDLLIWG